MPSVIDERCASCGMRYDDLRTGLTFAEVRRSMWVASDDPREWRYRRRRCVLREWRRIKLLMWGIHLGECAEALCSSTEVPF